MSRTFIVSCRTMMITRRRWLTTATAAAAWRPLTASLATAAQSEREPALASRIRRIISEYSEQGFHRTGTPVDERSAAWLSAEVRRAGLTPERELFTLDRVDPTNTAIVVDGRRIEGLPLFDGAFTDAAGIRGTLGPIDSDADIGLVEAPPNTAAAGPLAQARRHALRRAIVFVTRGGRPGLCPSNADAFLKPFGPPVVQVSSEESSFLTERAQRRGEITLVASVKRTRATAFNVTATIEGRNRALPPLVVMTPRSGWYSCASERGGGIVCWLELSRAAARPPGA